MKLQFGQFQILTALKGLLPGEGEGISIALGISDYLPDGRFDLPVVMTHSASGAVGSRLTKSIIAATEEININFHEFSVRKHPMLAFCVDSPTEPASILLFAIDAGRAIKFDQRAFIVEAVEKIESGLEDDTEVTWVYGSLLQGEEVMKKYY